MSWLLIPPSYFYNIPSGPPTSLCQLPTAAGPCPPLLFTTPIVNPQIDPTLMAALPQVGKSAPATPAAPSVEIPAPSDPSSNPVPPVSKCKLCEEFSGNDIEQLLRAVISVNPYLAPCSLITDKWKVTQIVQAEGACIGRDHEMLKNKVKSLLAWVHVHIAFFIHYFIPDGLTMCDRVAPTRNPHHPQWPMKQRRTRPFFPQSLAN